MDMPIEGGGPIGACIGVANFLVSTIIAAVGLANNKECEQLLQRTFLWVAFAFAVLSLICCCCCWMPGASDCNSCISFLIGTLFFTYYVFGASVTHKGGGEKLLGKSYKEYRLDHYSHWLRNRVNDTKRWHGISECLVRRHACKKMTKDWANITAEQFYTKKLSSIESGCCKPSNDCKFSYNTPTNWTKTFNSSFENSDCLLWSNDPNTWCFNCQACKAGVADKFKHTWKDILDLWK